MPIISYAEIDISKFSLAQILVLKVDYLESYVLYILFIRLYLVNFYINVSIAFLKSGI